jgi:hypothetical protein
MEPFHRCLAESRRSDETLLEALGQKRFDVGTVAWQAAFQSVAGTYPSETRRNDRPKGIPLSSKRICLRDHPPRHCQRPFDAGPVGAYPRPTEQIKGNLLS